VTAFSGLRGIRCYNLRCLSNLAVPSYSQVVSNGTGNARHVAHYNVMTIEETECLCHLKDEKKVYFTDTESVGKLLQVSVVDSNGCVVFGGHVNHGCETGV